MYRRPIIAASQILQAPARHQVRLFAQDAHLNKGGSDPARAATHGSKRPGSGEDVASSEMKSQGQGDQHAASSSKLDKKVGEKKFESDTLNVDSPQERAAQDTVKNN